MTAEGASGRYEARRTRARFAVGIDLGTTHSVIACAPLAPPGEPEVIRVPQLVTPTERRAEVLLPSMLYAPLAGEVPDEPDAAWVGGEVARRRGAEVPGRLVASAKSWLCHPQVDRVAAILPWGAGEESDVPRISPVDASARYLAHLARAFDEAHPDAPIAEQDVVLTVPASFDEVARELTLTAAVRAGLHVRLLEEPQAAFYDTMSRIGAEGLEGLLARSGGDALVLVCDVGGGTTDLSLIRVRRSDDHERAASGDVAVERIAVGHHLLLGGDNMDLALAYLCEQSLGTKLDAGRFGQLVAQCRAAKEKLLGDEAVDEVSITLLGSGASLVGGALKAKLTRQDAERVVLDGFFPEAPRDARPARAKSGLVAVGLPYERDVAITRHVAHFLARHADGALPSAVLLNGGVFRAKRIAERLVSAIEAWGGPALEVLPFDDPDLGVARGAVSYALALRGHGKRIEGGAARGYYVGLDASGEQRRAVCVVPRGAKEGVPHVAEGRRFALVVGRPVRFDLFASDEARVDAPGDVVTVDDEAFQALAPLTTTLGEARAKGAREIEVVLEGELTPIGTLDLACVERSASAPAGGERRFRLAFQLRDTEARPTSIPPSLGPPSLGGRRLEQARELIDKAFGKPRPDASERDVKDLFRDLEKLLGERATWTSETARALFDALIPGAKARRRSPDHERVFWMLAGFGARPGFGDPMDSTRIKAVVPLLPERLAFPDQARGWQQFFIALRRIAGGLDEAAQTHLRDTFDPFLAPPEKGLKKPKKFKPEGLDDLLDLASSLERVAAPRRSELGGWVLERTWTSRDPRLWAAIGRLGARIPAYASLHHVVSPLVAERWLDHLLREKWGKVPACARAAVDIARKTGDRARDINENVRRDVDKRLVESGARPEWLRAVREVVTLEEADRVAFFGESLPVGLRLVE